MHEDSHRTDTGPPEDLSYTSYQRQHATHGIHPYPAKFPPQLARWAIERYTTPGALVLDPFAGSGTTLVEARLLGRNAIGADIDPLARLIARAKSMPLAGGCVDAAWERLESAWGAAGVRHDGVCLPSIPTFPNRDKWFDPTVQRDLALLRDVIAAEPDRAVRDLFLVAYSATIIAKGPSTVANALDIAHSRAHHVERTEPPDVWRRFRDRCRRARRGLAEFVAGADDAVRVDVLAADARALPLASRSVDAVICSPPYVTAIEYPRGHKFSVWWIGPLLGVSNRVYERIRGDYIGTENVHRADRRALRTVRFGLPRVDGVIDALDTVDELRAGRAARYFADMRRALAEMVRVLRPGGEAVLVVGDSSLRGVSVPTGDCLIELAESLNDDGARFVHRQTVIRTIRERSRQLPIKRGANADGMKMEQVIVLQRGAARRIVHGVARSAGAEAAGDGGGDD